MGSSSISIGYIAYTAQIPSTELQTRVVSVCMGCGHPAAQLLQLLRVVSVECVWDAVTRRQDLLANRPSPYPSQVQRQSPSNTNRCWKCERDVGLMAIPT